MSYFKTTSVIIFAFLLSTLGLGVLTPSITLSQEELIVSSNESEEWQEAERLSEQVEQLFEEGKFNEAFPLAEKALALYKEVWGEEHPDVAIALNNLATLHLEYANYQEAETLLRQARDIQEKTLEEENSYSLRTLSNLASLYALQGKYSEAESAFINLLEKRKRLLGEEHPSVARTMAYLAVVYAGQGRLEEAQELLDKVQEIQKKSKN